MADNPAGVGPAGTVHCDLPSWAAFTSDQIAGARGEPALLSSSTYEALHTVVGDDHALGWLGTDRDWAGGPVLTHTGSNSLWYSVVWLAPEIDTAYLAVTNIAASDTGRALDGLIGALIEGGPTP
jgi:hypothetical protein